MVLKHIQEEYLAADLHCEVAFGAGSTCSSCGFKALKRIPVNLTGNKDGRSLRTVCPLVVVHIIIYLKSLTVLVFIRLVVSSNWMI